MRHPIKLGTSVYCYFPEEQKAKLCIATIGISARLKMAL